MKWDHAVKLKSGRIIHTRVIQGSICQVGGTWFTVGALERVGGMLYVNQQPGVLDFGATTLLLPAPSALQRETIEQEREDVWELLGEVLYAPPDRDDVLGIRLDTETGVFVTRCPDGTLHLHAEAVGLTDETVPLKMANIMQVLKQWLGEVGG